MSVIAITLPLAVPTTPAPTDTDINLDYAIASASSPFTKGSHSVDWGGRVWHARVTLPPMTRAVAAPWLAFFKRMRGRANYCLLGDWDRRTARGNPAGSPLVDGASQTGNGIAVKGFSAGATLLEEDHIQIENRLYAVVANFTADGSGEGTIQIEPNLRSSPADGAVITVSSPKGLFRMTHNYMPNPTDFNGIARLSFEMVEKL